MRLATLTLLAALVVPSVAPTSAAAARRAARLRCQFANRHGRVRVGEASDIGAGVLARGGNAVDAPSRRRSRSRSRIPPPAILAAADS
jgi:hypothetical protein